jgi:chromosome segregation ATPase
MRASRRLEKELATLTSRRQQIAVELTTAEQAATELQERFVSGEGSVEQLAAARGQIGALREALLPLDREVERLQQELAEAIKAEEESARQVRLAEIAIERQQLTANFYQLRDELNAVCANYGQKFLAIYEAWSKLRKEAIDLGATPPDNMAKRGWLEDYSIAIQEVIHKAGRIREREQRKVQPLAKAA